MDSKTQLAQTGPGFIGHFIFIFYSVPTEIDRDASCIEVNFSKLSLLIIAKLIWQQSLNYGLRKLCVLPLVIALRTY